MQPRRQTRASSEAISACTAMVSTVKLEAILKTASIQATNYEQQMKDLEQRLADSLKNFRNIDSQLQSAFATLRHNANQADQALGKQVPSIAHNLDSSIESLDLLAHDLPTIRSQVTDIRTVYDSGRNKAQNLVKDLTWLNTEFYERWRLIIFTSTSPVSWRWRAFMRIFFAASFITSAWLTFIAISGLVRAHRGGIIWGERLMS